MFNPEKLLGGLIRSGMRGKGLGALATGGAAMGLVGVAMAAAEHYMNRPDNNTRDAALSATGMENISKPAGAPPPPPGGSTVPPPPPGVRSAPVEQPKTGGGAVLLIRAMIAAANADGVIDAQERQQILEKLKSVDLSEEEHQFIVHELFEPKSLQEIVDAAAKHADFSQQVYAASALAITIDTAAERQYLSDLAVKLGLDAGTVETIHRKIGNDS